MNKKQLSIQNVIKKNYWFFILLGIAGIVCLFNIIPSVWAAPTDYEVTVDKFESFLAGFGVTGFSKMVEAYTTFGNFLTDDGGLTTAVTGFVKGIAAFMVLLYTLINMIKESQRGEIDMDYWFRIFASAAVAVLLVTSTNTVMNKLYDLGDMITTRIEQSLETAVAVDGDYADNEHSLMNDNPYFENDDSAETQKLMTALKKFPGMENIEDIVGNDQNIAESQWYKMQNVSEMLTILQYVVYLPLIICIFLMFSAVFELKIRQMFAPIAVASVAYDGARSTGVRYLKKYLGCFMKIAIYFSIAAIGAMLTYFFYKQMITATGSNAEDKIFMAFLMMLLSNIVAGLSMMQSGGLGDEIVGV